VRNTDPARLTVIRVRERDGHRCIICSDTVGLTTQHRVARGMGGSVPDWVNGPANLITLCGSGTTGCHGWVESHPTFAQEAGWSVRRGIILPAGVPVLYPESWVLLNDDGTLTPITTAEAGARGHGGSRPRGRGRAGDDPVVAAPWPPHPPWSSPAQDDGRPWGSAAGR
jgi:hypothetical protein